MRIIFCQGTTYPCQILSLYDIYAFSNLANVVRKKVQKVHTNLQIRKFAFRVQLLEAARRDRNIDRFTLDALQPDLWHLQA